jgi:L,D-peptidoglycan transpeptidase YkuD (ErfK/YbiS/YcfS/YnhG family)
MRATVYWTALLACVLVTTLVSIHAAPPALVRDANQLLLVITPDWNTVQGELRRFERGTLDEPWRAVGAPGLIVVGRNGFAWDPLATQPVPGPVKAEGDGRSPAGVFPLGKAFGYAPAAEAEWLKLPYLPVTEGVECVDDSASTLYNQIVDRRTIKTPDWNSSEKMREVGEAYRWGVVVNYNTPAVPKRGSCIFIHIGGEQGKGTAGCTAMAPDFLREVMAWIDPGRKPVLVQLPRAAYDALKPAWSLP